jgi:dihydroorotase
MGELMEISRRDFLVSGTMAAAGGVVGSAAEAGQTPVLLAQARAGLSPRGFNPADPALKYELVIANGEVLDPSQTLRGKRDIGIKYGQIAAIAPSIPADRAVQRIDADGKLVTPGLIDLHTHFCPHVGIGLPPDELVPITCHDDRGLRRRCRVADVGRLPPSRLAALAHAPVLLPPHRVDRVGRRARARRDAEHRLRERRGLREGRRREPDTVLGVKVRITDSIVGQNGLEPLRRALRAAEMAGKGVRVMCHIGAAPGNLSDLLDLLRPGDILTHSCSGAGNNTVHDE